MFYINVTSRIVMKTVTREYMFFVFMSAFQIFGSSGGVVVKLFACGAKGPGLDSRPRHLDFQRLVISCFQVEIWLKDR